MVTKTPIREEDQYEEFRRALLIDKDDLDREVVRYSDTYYRVASEYELLLAKRDDLSSRIKELKAEVGERLRRAAIVSGEKMTADSLDRLILLDDEVIDMAASIRKNGYALGELSALKEAHDKRQWMIGHLVTLSVSELRSLHPDRPAAAAAINSRVDEAPAPKPFNDAPPRRNFINRPRRDDET